MWVGESRTVQSSFKWSTEVDLGIQCMCWGCRVRREIESVTHYRQRFSHAGKANNLFTYLIVHYSYLKGSTLARTALLSPENIPRKYRENSVMAHCNSTDITSLLCFKLQNEIKNSHMPLLSAAFFQFFLVTMERVDFAHFHTKQPLK